MSGRYHRGLVKHRDAVLVRMGWVPRLFRRPPGPAKPSEALNEMAHDALRERITGRR